MDNAAETCEVAGSGALPTLAGAKGPEVHLVPVCAVRVGIACGRPLNCTASDGTRGIFYAVHVDGTLTGQRCIGDGEANDAGVITPGQVRRAFQRLDWPASPLIIQPPDGLTLVNFDTNFEVPPGP